jgi:hypothetical protein
VQQPDDSEVNIAENSAEEGDGDEPSRGEDELSQSSARDEPNEVMDIDADRSSSVSRSQTTERQTMIRACLSRGKC